MLLDGKVYDEYHLNKMHSNKCLSPFFNTSGLFSFPHLSLSCPPEMKKREREREKVCQIAWCVHLSVYECVSNQLVVKLEVCDEHGLDADVRKSRHLGVHALRNWDLSFGQFRTGL